MRLYLLDLLKCPRCEHFPLNINSCQTDDTPLLNKINQPCTIYCAYNNKFLADLQTPPDCFRCLNMKIIRGELSCPNCLSIFRIKDSIVDLLTDETKQEWVSSEKSWWENKYTQSSNVVRPEIPEVAGADKINIVSDRMYERNKHLFQPLSEFDIDNTIMLEIGCGKSEYVAKLLPPDKYGYLYIGTDIARSGLLQAVDLIPSGDFMLCSAGSLAFRRTTIDVLLSLGVLHHIPEWQISLGKLLSTLRQGGWFLFNEAIEKPRVLGTFRKSSLTADIDSPHEGEIERDTLLSIMRQHGSILSYQVESTPLRVLLIWLIRRWITRSVLLTKTILYLDQVFLKIFGKIFPSLGAGEIIGIFQKME